MAVSRNAEQDLQEFVRAWARTHAKTRSLEEAESVAVHRAQEVVVLGDGAEWIWNHAAVHHPGTRTWLTRLQEDIGSLRAAFDWTLGSRDHAELAQALAAGLLPFWLTSAWSESRQRLADSLVAGPVRATWPRPCGTWAGRPTGRLLPFVLYGHWHCAAGGHRHCGRIR